ncbi:MAG: FIG00456093: hypothetical protein [uncultured Paraburkholderia sp.]|nr:MAG: FIG00456093: hypothetical protein [uncultured Paraburkholderia sp.]CAH2939919.1 MAG: FIG00456093: hypothetical protein [uncultured Paraburkholderia sp.]
MKRSTLSALAANGTAASAKTNAASAAGATAPPKQGTQAAQPGDAAASMVKPPELASGATGSSNPDNMPIKRPRKPTNDKMMHEPPASGANAK